MKKFNAKDKGIIGATMAEFALGLPIIMLLIMFLVDSGLYLFQRSILTDITARLNREIVTLLGQKEAEISFCDNHTMPKPLACGTVLPPNSNELKTLAITIKEDLKSSKAILFEGTRIRLRISNNNNSSIGYRLVTTTGEKDFQCILCKLFPSVPQMTHRSVLVIERPQFASQVTLPETELIGP